MSYYTAAERDEELYLEHYGVKGMRWGVRKSKQERQKARGEKREKREQKNKDIIAARKRQKNREKDIRRKEMAVYKSVVSGGYKEANKAYSEAQKAYYKNPDRKTARRRTSGEKKITAVLATAAASYVLYNVAGEMALRKLAVTDDSGLKGLADKAFKPKVIKPNRQGVYNVTTLK